MRRNADSRTRASPCLGQERRNVPVRADGAPTVRPSIEGLQIQTPNSAKKPFTSSMGSIRSNLPSDLPSITVICLG